MTPSDACRTARGRARPRQALALVELSMGVAILAVLAALLSPADDGARESARATACDRRAPVRP